MKSTSSALLLTRIEKSGRVWVYDQFTPEQCRKMRQKGWGIITDESQKRYERGRKDAHAKCLPL